MGFDEELDVYRQESARLSPLERVLKALNPEDTKKFQAAVVNPEVPAAAIHAVLQKRGIRVGITAVSGWCREARSVVRR